MPAVQQLYSSSGGTNNRTPAACREYKQAMRWDAATLTLLLYYLVLYLQIQSVCCSFIAFASYTRAMYSSVTSTIRVYTIRVQLSQFRCLRCGVCMSCVAVPSILGATLAPLEVVRRFNRGHTGESQSTMEFPLFCVYFHLRCLVLALIFYRDFCATKYLILLYTKCACCC